MKAVKLILPLIILAGCINKVERKTFPPSQKLPPSLITPFLKAHMKDGSIYVFESWKIDEENRTVSGEATLYDKYRRFVKKDNFTISIDSVALFETNKLKTAGSAAITPLVLMTMVSIPITIACLSNPKACFGSCPTFYVLEGDSFRLQAEGFSASILPLFEAVDVDALYHVKHKGNELVLQMKNEALETHVVRYVDILAVPRDRGKRVFATKDNRFYSVSNIIPPRYAVAEEGDILPLILKPDGRERFSYADSSYLGAKEEINLEFKVKPNGDYGIIIAHRHTLLTTFIFYQILAYMGSNAGYYLAKVEGNKGGKNKIYNRLFLDVLGGLDVFVYYPNRGWKKIETIYEPGPIATDFHIFPIEGLRDSVIKVKLRMTKGMWRIDYVALGEIEKEVKPLRIRPYEVLKEGERDTVAFTNLVDTTKYLTTLPGDVYTLKYRLPNGDYELFIQSKGYYLEWIRKEWIAEENPLLLFELMLLPELALRRLAPEFKRIEGTMEYYFWRSRYANGQI